MSDNQELKSFWGRGRVMSKVYIERILRPSVVKEFIAFDPVHGPILKAEMKVKMESIDFDAEIVVAAALSVGGWKSKRNPKSCAAILVANTGYNWYPVPKMDRMAAYVRFNEWLEKRV